jgi:uncharacterized protein (TIGR02996 family)
MTDATGQMLLRAIVEEPDADDVRLIYADWLQDHGDPARAEFIRLQCRLATMDEGDPARPALEDREADLLAAHRDRWLGELPEGLCRIEPGLPKFRRGFPDALEIGCRDFVQRGDELLRVTPLDSIAIRGIGQLLAMVRYSTREEQLAALSTREGRLVVNLDEGAALLANCPLLAHVRRLDLAETHMGTDHLTTILASPYLPSLEKLALEKLDLGGAWFESRVAEVLAAWPGLGWLRELSLSANYLDAEGVAVLTKFPHLAGLRALDLSINPLGLEGVRHLAACPHLVGLERLRLASVYGSGQDIGRHAINALVDSPFLHRLRCLDVADLASGSEGARALSRAVFTSGLQTLRLRKNSLGDKGALRLARTEALCPVVLDLGETAIGPIGMEALVESPCVSRLRKLNLSDNKIGNRGGVALFRSSSLTRLRTVELGSTDIGDETVLALVASPHAHRLRRLYLDHNTITDAGARAMVESPALEGLEYLNLWGNVITRPVLEALWSRFGDRVYPQRRQWKQEGGPV